MFPFRRKSMEKHDGELIATAFFKENAYTGRSDDRNVSTVIGARDTERHYQASGSSCRRLPVIMESN